MANIEIARLFKKVAAALTILNADRFRILAYDKAAVAVEHATSEIKDLWDDNKLDTLPGIGKSLQAHLDELFRTGKVREFDAIFAKVPQAVFPLLEIPGLGPKRAYALVTQLGIKNAQSAVEDLEKAALHNKIAQLENFGEISEKDISQNITLWKKGAVKTNRILINKADAIADELICFLNIKAERLGSLRRRVSTIGDIDLAVATKKPEELVKNFVSYPHKTQIIEQGSTGASILLSSGRQVDLRVCRPEEWGSLLQYFTGSKQHNIALREYALKKGFSLSEYGIKSQKLKSKLFKFNNEKGFYNFLGLDYIEPELREDTGEIQSAAGHNLPKLVELSDIKGDLQSHSNYDLVPSHDLGEDSMESMLQKADRLGYEWFAFSEHNPAVSVLTPEKILEILKKRQDFIFSLKSKVGILNLLEVDLDPDGRPNLPDGAERYLDGILVSVHSSFKLDREKMTARVLRGLSHPLARIFAHPTGRLLGEREGYELNWPEIFEFCRKNDKAIEINAHPNRLDLPDVLVREAVKLGVKLSIGTDSHNKEDLVNMKYGVAVARRGWAQKSDIINTWNYESLIEWIKKRR
jgi:DNA polymerase (family 10)